MGSLVQQSILLFYIAFAVLVSHSTAQHRQIPNAGHHYPVNIGAEGRIVQGRVSSESAPGDLVPSNVVPEGAEDADMTIHLRVEVRNSIYKRPHVYHPDSIDNSSVVEEFKNGSLPIGMQFVVVHTNAFYVNEDRYITVNDFSSLNGETRIHFDIILKDNLADTKYVSNQLHFVVEIEYPKRELNPNAVLFAGVLVLTIVSISLLIPFVVRAKRRCKAGKPIFRCGSADDASDIESLGSVPEHLKKRANSIGGKDNLAMILDNGRMKHQRSSVDRHTTIQNHMLRSTSGFQFQPHCMDPHYNDVYERPDFSRFASQSSSQVKENGTQCSRKAYTHLNSNRSSVSSDTIFPDNFNKDRSRNTPGLAEAVGTGTRKMNDFPRKMNEVSQRTNDILQKTKYAPALNGSALKTSLSESQISTSYAKSNAATNPDGAQRKMETSDTSPSIENAHL